MTQHTVQPDDFRPDPEDNVSLYHVPGKWTHRVLLDSGSRSREDVRGSIEVHITERNSRNAGFLDNCKRAL